MQVIYNTDISPVQVIPTLQTCKIVYYILLNKLKSVALCLRLDQLIAYYCVRRNMAKFTSRFPRNRRVPVYEKNTGASKISISHKCSAWCM